MWEMCGSPHWTGVKALQCSAPSDWNCVDKDKIITLCSCVYCMMPVMFWTCYIYLFLSFNHMKHVFCLYFVCQQNVTVWLMLSFPLRKSLQKEVFFFLIHHTVIITEKYDRKPLNHIHNKNNSMIFQFVYLPSLNIINQFV